MFDVQVPGIGKVTDRIISQVKEVVGRVSGCMRESISSAVAFDRV